MQWRFSPFFLFFAFFAFAEPSFEQYIKNDLELKKLALEVKKETLASESTAIDNGFAIKVSTGTISLYNTGDDINFSFEPSVSATVPHWQNLSLKVDSSVKITEGKNDTENTKIALSLDIISGNNLLRKANLMNADRNVLKAKRNLQDRALSCEKEYYTELKKLFTAFSEITEDKRKLFEDKIDFDDIKAKDYFSSSSKYRLAELKVLSDEHDIKIKTRKLKHDCAVFAVKCSTTFSYDEEIEDFLPKIIENVEPVDVLSFPKETYAKIENAEWTYEYNTIKRKADKNWTLSGNAGYTINNSASSTDTVDVGLETNWKGIGVGASLSFPIESGTQPVYNLTATVDPNSIRKQKRTKKQQDWTSEQELIDIKKANDDYDTDVVERKQALIDIKWSKKTNAESFDMYDSLEKDMLVNFNEGIVTESEYLSSLTNKENYRIKLLIDNIDLIIYNNETKLLFCRD